MSIAATRVFGASLRGNEYQCARCGKVVTYNGANTKPTYCRDCPEVPPSLPNQEWIVDALCAQVGMEVFFPPTSGPNRQAKEICARCDVRSQCLDYALSTDQAFGVWGGLSAFERKARRGEQGAA